MTEFTIPSTYEQILHEDLKDVRAEGILLKHKKSGARIALVPCSDTNKVFYIAFRTPPSDSAGAAHIVEHTVLCGSEKYPLKDPFIELLKGSMNTYLNATTYPDKTMYPVASTNDRDFRNLTDVYLDAVFHPNIYHEENIFRQEGWSLRMEDPESPLEVSGVVYNEMKGAFSSPEEILGRRIDEALFPDTPYGLESGGDPAVIPELTYEKFLEFHKTYYHPSNSYIYFYGDIDIDETLTYLDREYLSGFEAQEPSPMIPLQKAPEQAVYERVSYPISADEEEEGKTYLSYSVVTGDLDDLKAQIAIDVLDYALFSMPGAPVRKSLIDAGIGNDVYGSYSDGILQPCFSIVARNAEAEQEEAFLRIIRESLETAVRDGIDRDALLAGISSMEFQFREADYMMWPKGLIYGIDMMDSWLYDDLAAFTALKQLPAFLSLREEASEGTGYFERLVQEKLLDNPHCAVITMVPERGKQEREDEAQCAVLAAKKAAMSEAEILETVRETESLRIWQETDDSDEAIASLPGLHLTDLCREPAAFSNVAHSVSFGKDDRTISVICHDTESNGIGYVQILFAADSIDQQDLPYLSILRSLLMNVDTEHRRYVDLINAVNQRTGGISCSFTTCSDASDPEKFYPYLMFSGRALYEEQPFLFEMLGEIITETKLDDVKRIREVLAELYSRMQMYLMHAGHSAAATHALACLSAEYHVQDEAAGLAFYRSLGSILEDFENDPHSVLKKLERVKRAVFRTENMTVGYTSSEDGRGVLDENIRKLADQIEASGKDAFTEGTAPVKAIRPAANKKEGLYTGGQVQNVAMAFSFEEEEAPNNGTLMVLRHILNTGYLWDTVRVDGNAYGCSANFMLRSRLANFVSYRDPHLAGTIEAYRNLADYLEQFEADEEEMEKYIIGTISSLDVPMTASVFGSSSMRVYICGITQEMLKKEREEVMSVRSEDIRSCAGFIRRMFEHSALCVAGSESGIRKRQELFDEIGSLL